MCTASLFSFTRSSERLICMQTMQVDINSDEIKKKKNNKSQLIILFLRKKIVINCLSQP